MSDKTSEELFEEWWKSPSVKSPYGVGGGLYSPASLAVSRRKSAAREAFYYAYEIKDKEIEKLKEQLGKANDVIRFYGDFETYGTTKNVRPRIPWENRLITSKDVDDSLKGIFPCGGKRARDYLKQLEQG